MIRLALASVLLLGCAARSEIAGDNFDASVVDAPAVDAPAVDAANDACAALQSNLDEAGKLAAACCPTCNSVQCASQLPGVCCPLAVSIASSPAATSYLDALDAFKKSGCPIFCPFGCPAPQRTCGADSVCEQP